MKVYNYAKTKALMEKISDNHAHQDKLVYDALVKLGGRIQMRVMEFRKHISEPMRETQIKKALIRLREQGIIEMIGEKHDSRGHAYRIV